MSFLRCSIAGLSLFSFLAFAPSASAAVLGRRPYVQNVTKTQAVIVWTTDVATSSVVTLGAGPKALDKVISDPASVTQHEVLLSGLSPDKRYYYKIGDSAGYLEGDDGNHFFETAPALGSRNRLRAWIVGDSGTGGSSQRAVRDAMLAYTGNQRPDMFLHMGDIAYAAGLTQEFTDYFFRVYADILTSTPTFPTLGNHEGANSDSPTQTGTYYTAYVLPKAGEGGGLASGTEAYYSFDWANAHFIVLDSQDSPRDPAGAMLTWAKADIQATNQEWVIAYWHHPAYTKGTHNSDSESQLVQMRENALPILEAGGVDLVLAGHSHIYERSFLLDGAYDTPTTAGAHILDSGDGKPLGNGPYTKPEGGGAHDGAVYVVAGHGGTSVGGTGGHPVMYMSEVQNGSCILDIQENRLSLVNVRWDGALTDKFAMVKGTGLVLVAPDGEEAVSAGQSYVIRWATSGNIAEVKLELSTNEGASWTPIAGPLPNTGSYTWTVPAVDTRLGLVRVSSVADPAIHDDSNARFAMTKSAPSVLVPLGSTWRYEDQGVDQGALWLTPGFDDSSWKEGPAQLGYGDGDEATALDASMPVAPSVYFRKHFTLAGDVVKASLRAIHDDGVAVWINGVPVFSRYMDDGLEYGAWASQKSADNELSEGSVPLSRDPFLVGDNVITAMVKQSDALSSDLSFDLELSAVIGPLPVSTGAGGAGGMDTGAGGVNAGAGGVNAGAGGVNAGAGGGSSGESGNCGCRFTGTTETPVSMIGFVVLSAALSRRRRKVIASRLHQG